MRQCVSSQQTNIQKSPMQNYLQQLLSDLKSAAKNPPTHPWPVVDPDDPMSGVETYLKAPLHTYAYWTGIEKEVFPPAEKLTKAECGMLTQAIISLWQAYNIWPELPKAMPVEFQYEVLINSWDEEVSYMPAGAHGGMVVMDFCDGYAPDCILKTYCACREIWESDENEEMSDNEQG